MHNLHYMHKMHNNAVIGVLCTNNLLQDGFCPREVEFLSLQAMSKAMIDRMLPDTKVNVISLREGTYLFILKQVICIICIIFVRLAGPSQRDHAL